MKHILAMDGGGIRGIIPATFLVRLEKDTQTQTHKLFDLIAGTSAGGINACALTKPQPFSAQQTATFYTDYGPKIFKRSWTSILTGGQLLHSKFPAAGIEESLEYFFGGEELKETLTDLLIPTFEMLSYAPYFFKTAKARINPLDNFLLRDVARATAAAQTYFPPLYLKQKLLTLRQRQAQGLPKLPTSPKATRIPGIKHILKNARLTAFLPDFSLLYPHPHPHPPTEQVPTPPGLPVIPPNPAPVPQAPVGITTTQEDYIFTDGGVFANDPAICALAEAIKRWPGEQYNIISFGTGRAQPKYDRVGNWGIVQWGKPLINILLDAVLEVVEYQIEQCLPEGQYFRLQPILSQAQSALDNVSPDNINSLISLTNNYIDSQPDQWAHLIKSLEIH
jgi:hypothetical protein